jgi:hypothetical protein
MIAVAQVEMLLANGASVNVQCRYGSTPLQLAAELEVSACCSVVLHAR